MKIHKIIVLFLLSFNALNSFSYPLGDVNHNNAVEITDALLTAQYYVKANPLNFDASLADVNHNHVIDIVDSLFMAKKYVGLIDEFPGSGGGDSLCNHHGKVSYHLVKKSNPTKEQREAYQLIKNAMDKAVEYYSCYTTRDMHITVHYNPGVPTAQANLKGPISFGKKFYMNHITAMHELAHCFGIGTHWKWAQLITNKKIYTGKQANAKLRELTNNPKAEIHGDRMHFWPYGLNYKEEAKSEEDLIFHCKIVEAISKDMGY